MGATTLWFSDAAPVPVPLPYCLVCWAYGGFMWNHAEIDGAVAS